LSDILFWYPKSQMEKRKQESTRHWLAMHVVKIIVIWDLAKFDSSFTLLLY